MLPSKIEAIQKLIPPQDKTGIRHIIGLAGFYRHFINNFAEITQPLTEALKGDNIKEKIAWTEEMQNSFELLKQKFAEYPILLVPNFEQEFILETDANLKRIAALLNQLKSGLLALVSWDENTWV